MQQQARGQGASSPPSPFLLCAEDGGGGSSWLNVCAELKQGHPMCVRTHNQEVLAGLLSCGCVFSRRAACRSLFTVAASLGFPVRDSATINPLSVLYSDIFCKDWQKSSSAATQSFLVKMMGCIRACAGGADLQ